MSKLTITLTVDDANVNLKAYTEGEGTMTLQEAVEYDADLYESGDISLEEFIHSYGGSVTVSEVRAYDDDEVSDGSNKG